MSEKPTIHVTNWSSRKLHGPRRKLGIMAAPRPWERGDGEVPALVPLLDDMRAAKSRGDFEGYRARYVDRIERTSGAIDNGPPFPMGHLAPGGLWARLGWGAALVSDGDTLCCSCGREQAAQGRCHRVPAAELLRRMGWRVVLDGRELVGVDADWRPVFA